MKIMIDIVISKWLLKHYICKAKGDVLVTALLVVRHVKFLAHVACFGGYSCIRLVVAHTLTLVEIRLCNMQCSEFVCFQ